MSLKTVNRKTLFSFLRRSNFSGITKIRSMALSCLLFSYEILFSQNEISNEEFFENEILRRHQENKIRIKKLEGSITQTLEASISIDTVASKILVIGEPEIRFHRIGKDLFQRFLRFDMTYVDSLSSKQEVAATDTLKITKWKSIRRSAIIALRGTRDDNFSRIILPTGLIFLGVAGILSLFYIRS